MMHLVDKRYCCGCGACANICPKGAIAMTADSLGFFYPVLDKAKCVECGFCVKECSFLSDYNRYHLYDEPLVFGCRHKDENELSKSQSGALAFAIAEFFISIGGIVYGAVLKSHSLVEHCRCTTESEIQRTRYSKYIQSNPYNSFKEIKKDLTEGRKVLFFGTPCQVAGLKSLIKEDCQELLFTCDLMCHAVPSPAVWRDYCKALEAKTHGIIENVIFRDKKLGWHSHSESFAIVKRNKKRLTITKQTFRKMFYAHLIVRESCSACPYTNFRRVGDITCGDFWGWEKYHSEWNDNKGVSLALVNSDKGRLLFKNANIDFIKSNQLECVQPQLVSPIQLSPLYHKVVKDYEKRGFVYIAKKYADWGWRYKMKVFKKYIKRFTGYNRLKILLKK